jgi:hypothetical protein
MPAKSRVALRVDFGALRFRCKALHRRVQLIALIARESE